AGFFLCERDQPMWRWHRQDRLVLPFIFFSGGMDAIRRSNISAVGFDIEASADSRLTGWQWRIEQKPEVLTATGQRGQRRVKSVILVFKILYRGEAIGSIDIKHKNPARCACSDSDVVGKSRKPAFEPLGVAGGIIKTPAAFERFFGPDLEGKDLPPLRG